MRRPTIDDAGFAFIIFWWVVCFLFFLYAATGCGNNEFPLSPNYCEEAPQQALIINGTPSVFRRGTMFVRIDGNYCTGTVVGPHTVLTAAHCYGERMAVGYEPGEYIFAEDTLVHPDYVYFPFNDLMLVYTEEQMLPPYVEVYDYQEGDLCTATFVQGWGQNEDGTLELREKAYDIIDSGFYLIRANGIDGSACFGDSGGPLYVLVDDKLYLAGSLSTGFDGSCLNGTYHVNLSSYKDWIKENTQ